MTDPIISPEVIDQAEAIVQAHLVPREIAVGLLDAIARALQVEVNRAELALVERTQAVATMTRAEAERAQAVATTKRLCERLRELADTAVIEAWFTCPRCGERGPKVDAIEHDEQCVLSLRPPARLSLVSPKRDTEEDDIA